MCRGRGHGDGLFGMGARKQPRGKNSVSQPYGTLVASHAP